MAEIYNPYCEGFKRLSSTAWTDTGGRRTRTLREAVGPVVEGPPAKRRGNPNPNSSSDSHRSFGFNMLKTTENDRFCVPSLTQDNKGNSCYEFRPAEPNLDDDPDVYYTREAIERHSPSRRDGIDWQKETFLRCSYVSFLQNLGMRLNLPQTVIATAVVLCHRFFLRRSHATNDRYLIATACMFLVAKSEENARPLNTVLLLSYELCHMHDLSRFHYMLPNDWFEQYKQRVLDAEKMILTTLNFELTVQHPYEPLMTVLNKSGLAQTALIRVAWNLITDGLFRVYSNQK
eukprot:TRINITY_DN182_c0_g1_i4.p1 TRINITY_DN182_c0_g1~~TRINITY_DN182_c0_g1_i4.p1  ORF type:complete len:289 (+),score=21.79 TRINITY_DN182_c0_g1_i4:245-1111(+)